MIDGWASICCVQAVHKPISLRDAGRGDKNEIFVDVIDRISATFNANGQVRTFTIDGSIQMKSYLTGSPQARSTRFQPGPACGPPLRLACR